MSDFSQIDKWLNSVKLSDEELIQLFLTRRPDNINIDEVLFNELSNRVIQSLNNPNITSDKYQLEVEKDATTLIQRLFDIHVADDVLVICTSLEHPNVLQIIENTCKNILMLDYDNEVRILDMTRVIQYVKKFKSVFIYVIGVDKTAGKITPKPFLEQIIDICNHNCQNVVSVIDDVHGMFVNCHDYSKFNYIIGTSHALNRGFNMGLCFRKKTSTHTIGIQPANWIEKYLMTLEIFLRRKKQLMLFSDVMKNHFLKSSFSEKNEFFDDCVSNIFSVRVNGCIIPENAVEPFKMYECMVEDAMSTHPFFTLRAAQFVTFPHLLKPVIELLDLIIMKGIQTYGEQK